MTSTWLEGKLGWRGQAGEEEGLEGVQTVLPMKGTVRTSIRGDADALGFLIGEPPRFVFFLLP